MSQELRSEDAVKKFKELVETVNVCMFTTLDDSNTIFSRPMSTVKIDDEGNAWFLRMNILKKSRKYPGTIRSLSFMPIQGKMYMSQ